MQGSFSRLSGEVVDESDRLLGSKLGVAESRHECQLYIYPKVSLSLGFKNPIKEVSYLKSATPVFYYSFRIAIDEHQLSRKNALCCADI
jgi:hypothetical protein